MKILLADDMDIVREGIACEIKKVIPDAEIDDFSDGKYAWSGACRASPFRILIYSSGIRKMTVPLGDRKINSKTDKVVAVIRKYPLII